MRENSLLNEIQSTNKVESHGYLETIENFLSSSPMGLFTLANSGVILKVNSAGAHTLGVEAEGLIGKNYARYVAPDYQKEFAQYLLCLSGSYQTETCEIKMLQRYKPLFYTTLHGKKIIHPRDGSSLLMVLMINHKKREAAGVNGSLDNQMVNNLNQPLAIIANYIYGCIHRLESGKYRISDVLQAMKQAEQELHRVAEIIMRMKNFSCRETLQYEPAEIDNVINEIISIINYEIVDYPVSIEFRSVKGLPGLILDKLYIQQAILNLARNAIDAMRSGNQKEPRLIIEVNQVNRDLLEICLMDNGCAFNIESIHKLFEPEFTTKTYGVGLGLVISRIIVEAHGGKLFAGLNPTGGACFRIELPMLAST